MDANQGPGALPAVGPLQQQPAPHDNSQQVSAQLAHAFSFASPAPAAYQVFDVPRNALTEGLATPDASFLPSAGGSSRVPQPLARQLSPYPLASPQSQALAATLQSAQKQRVSGAARNAPNWKPHCDGQLARGRIVVCSNRTLQLPNCAPTATSAQELAASMLQGLHAAAAAKKLAPQALTARDKENAAAAAFCRVSPGHFVLHPGLAAGHAASPHPAAAGSDGEPAAHRKRAAAAAPGSEGALGVGSVAVDYVSTSLGPAGELSSLQHTAS